jgi:acetate kinase
MDDIELPFEGPAESQYGEALRFLVRWLREHEAGWRVTAVGHRVVHGGRSVSRHRPCSIRR